MATWVRNVDPPTLSSTKESHGRTGTGADDGDECEEDLLRTREKEKRLVLSSEPRRGLQPDLLSAEGSSSPSAVGLGILRPVECVCVCVCVCLCVCVCVCV